MTNAADDNQSRKRGKVIPFQKDELSDLRSLLMSKELSEIEEILERLDDPDTRAREIARILPRAIAKRAALDKELASALGPTVEEILRASVKRNPQTLVDSLFPVMGPAIRKSIAEFFRGMIQGLNHAMQHSLSLQGLKWRLEALRTGKSFTEIVLLHSLVFRVEQVFLVHQKTGLLLSQVSAESVVAEDPDMVSSMMTAVQDFVKDSFHAGEGEGLENLQLGELTVMVEQGPLAYLAAIIRGTPPPELRETCKDVLERVHLDLREELEEFDGDPAPFAVAIPRLEACLADRYVEDPAKKSFSYAWLLLLAVLIPVAYWGFCEVRATLHWRAFIDNLRGTKGIVVTSTGKKDGRYSVTGLRDPLARDPGTLAASSGIDSGRLAARWETFHALDPEFVLSRAKQALSPPSTVTLTLDRGVLKATGSAPFEWAQEAKRLSRILPGVDDYRDEDLLVSYDVVLSRIREALDPPETVSLKLEKGILTATGSAPQQWALTARRLSRLFPAVVEYQDSGLRIVRLTYPDIGEVKRVLDSPETVSFSLENKTLVARGSAPYKWSMDARKLVRFIPGVDRYDDGKLTITYDQVLRQAREVLDPPDAVELSMANGVLTARGRAPGQWIKEARRLAGLVPGVTEYQDTGVAELPVITLNKLREILDPPKTVTLQLASGVLWVSGSAPHGWITETRARVGLIPGLAGYREKDLKDLDLERLNVLTPLIERTMLYFESSADRLVPGQDEVVSQLVSRTAELQKLADVLGRKVQIKITGHTDSVGTEEMNLALSSRRADYVASILAGRGIAPANIAVRGVGALEPISSGTTEQERALNRRVTFALTVGDQKNDKPPALPGDSQGFDSPRE